MTAVKVFEIPNFLCNGFLNLAELVAVNKTICDPGWEVKNVK